MDYALRFPDEPSSFAIALALDAVEVLDDVPRLVRFTHRYAIDVIGAVTLPPVVEGEPGETLPGWHVNLRILDGSALPAACEPFVVHPAQPVRVWA